MLVTYGTCLLYAFLLISYSVSGTFEENSCAFMEFLDVCMLYQFLDELLWKFEEYLSCFKLLHRQIALFCLMDEMGQGVLRLSV